MTAPAERSVLVVDDDAEIRKVIERVLVRMGVRVTLAKDGAEAIYHTVGASFDLITMDLMMPNVDGFEAIRAIRDVDPGCRIVVVTSMTDKESRERAAALQVTQYVTKPVLVRRMRKLFARLLGLEKPVTPAPAPALT
jgi:CheY-like chemotaxis protein